MEGISNQLILVTGASGFVASHIIKSLLELGAKVRGTVRSLENEEKVGFLRNLVENPKHKLELVEADLLKEETWKNAVKGCKYVLHVASPFPMAIPNSPDELIKPAVDGTLNVLKACQEEKSVKRVVVTSSLVAVYEPYLPFPKDAEESKTLTEEHWVDGNDENVEAYPRSKALAEKAAWDFVKEIPADKNKFELAVINPGLVLGPLLNKSNSTSIEVIRLLLDRAVPAVAKTYLPICDVRDVAQAHIKALVTKDAAGHRHNVYTDSLWMKQIALILQKEFKPKGFNIPTLVAPNFLVWINSLIDKKYKTVVSRLGKEFKFSNERLRNVLGITPIECEKTIIDSANALIDLGIVKTKTKKQKKTETDAKVENADEKSKELEPEEKERINAEKTTTEVST